MKTIKPIIQGITDVLIDNHQNIIKYATGMIIGKIGVPKISDSKSRFIISKLNNIYLRGVHVKDETNFPDIQVNNKARIGRLVIQKHDASHKHFDVSIIDGKEEIFRGAVTKSELDKLFPKTSSKSTAFVRQPQHDLKYLLKTPDKFEIPEGYGKGTVERVFNNQIEIHKTDNNKISFSIYDDILKGRYSLQHRKAGFWQCIRKKEEVPTISGRGNFKKVNGNDTKSKELTPEMRKQIDKFIIDKKSGAKYPVIYEEKYRGGCVFLKLDNDGNTIWSHRKSKTTGKAIFHHDKFPEIRDEIHPEFDGTELYGELLFVKGNIKRLDGKFFKSNGRQLENIISKLSNTKNPLESRESKKLEKGETGFVVWNIHKYKGKNVENLTYGEKITLIDSITEKSKKLYSPRRFDDLDKAWKTIVIDEHGEGLVVKRLDITTPQPDTVGTGAWLKIKDKDFIDARIIGWKPTTKITGIIDDSLVGEFTVQDENGINFSCPATGCSHIQRKWIRENIDKILKDESIIRVGYEGIVKDKPLKPVFNSIHTEKSEGIILKLPERE